MQVEKPQKLLQKADATDFLQCDGILVLPESKS